MRKNLAVNPSLRDGTTAGYVAIGGATLAVDEDYAYYGKYALRVQKDGTNGSGVQTLDPIPVVPGQPYAFSWKARLPVTIPQAETSQIVLQVDWQNSLGVITSTGVSATLTLDDDSDWYSIGGVWTAPASATFVDVSVYQPLAGAKNAVILLDALLVEQANYIGGYFDNIPSEKKYEVAQRALSAMPQVINGLRLGADIVLDDLVLNTIDEDDTIWVCTDLDGWWGQTNPELPDIARGTEDGSYDVEGRFTARTISLSGFFIPKDPGKSLTNSINRLVEAASLVRRGGWLYTHEDPTKAAFVRLASKPIVRTINARGRTEFTITLRAGDPIKYHWDDKDPEGYTNLQFEAADVIGMAENIGTARVTGTFTFTGPAGAGTRVYNATTDETMTLKEPLRGAGLVAEVYEATATDGVATVKTVAPNHLRPGDEVSLLGMVIPFSSSTETRTVLAVSEVYPFSFSFEINTDDITPISTAGQVVLLANDTLEVDTYNRSVTYNGEKSGHRHRLTVLTDWIHFESGDNLIEFYDNLTEVEVASKQLTSNVVTLVTADTHYLIPGEEIKVNLPVEKPLAKKSLSGNIVTLTTAEPHGFSEGDVVNVASSTSARVVTKSRTGNIATLTTQQPHGINVSDSVTVALPSTVAPTTKSLTSNVATLTTQSPHGFSTGDSVTVAMPVNASVSAKQLINNQVTLTTNAPHNFVVGDNILVTMPAGASVVEKSRSGSQAIITTSTPHGFSVGDSVIMSLPTTATLAGAILGSEATRLVTLTFSTPHNFSQGDKLTISGLSVARWNGTKVIETVPSTFSVTFRDWELTSNVSVQPTGGAVFNTTNSSYNGTKTLVSASGTTFSYNY